MKFVRRGNSVWSKILQIHQIFVCLVWIMLIAKEGLKLLSIKDFGEITLIQAKFLNVFKVMLVREDLSQSAVRDIQDIFVHLALKILNDQVISDAQNASIPYLMFLEFLDFSFF